MFKRRRIAIKALTLAGLLCASALAWAGQVAGTVVNLSGALLAKKADGTVKVLALRSEVEQGDTLVAEKGTYAQIKFIDNSEITLKPNASFKIDKFNFETDKPAADAAEFSLVKGGLRSITGLLGKRNKEKFLMKTPTATIGIRGTTFDAEYVEESAEALAAKQDYLMASTADLGNSLPVKPLQLAQLGQPPKPGAPGGTLRPGLHVFVLDGLIQLSNSGGSMQFTAGQFGFTPSFKQPPVVVPNNPGLKFTPPPAFQVSSGQPGSNTGKTTSNTVDCEVR
jgi:hypothetical protein